MSTNATAEWRRWDAARDALEAARREAEAANAAFAEADREYQRASQGLVYALESNDLTEQ